MPAYPINTTVQLLHDVPLSPRMPHRIRFASASARESYFAGKVYNSQTEIQLQRVEGIYRLPVALDDAIAACNYMRWQNKTGQWYYAFITRMEYMNSNLTRVEFEVDAWTTFQFDLTWGDCFIERECVSDDTPGLHTLPELVDVGQYEVTRNFRTNDFPGVGDNLTLDLVPCIFMSNWLISRDGAVSHGQTGGYDANTVSFDNIWIPSPTTFTNGIDAEAMGEQITNFVTFANENAQASAIIMAGCLPINAVQRTNVGGLAVMENGGTVDPSYGYFIQYANSYFDIQNVTADLPISVAGWPTVYNNKLYMYPYRYYMLSNGAGETLDLYPHLIPEAVNPSDPTTRRLALQFSTSHDIEAVYTCTLNNYGGGTKDTQALSVTNFPTFTVNTQAFAGWLAGTAGRRGAQAVNLITGTVAGAAGGAANALAGNAAGFGQIAGLIPNIIGTVSNVLGEGYDASRAPAITHSKSSGAGHNASRTLGITLLDVAITPEYATVIDNYFSMYGYKVNRMGTPEFATRQYWNFYKIPSCVVYADIPGDYLEQIRDLFINGVTLWNTTDVGNYHNGSNPIVGG